MAIGKRLLANPLVQSAAALVLAGYIRLVFLTSRIEETGSAKALAWRREKRPYAAAFWHGRMVLMCAAVVPGARQDVLISAHRDGQLISRVIRAFGLGTIAGSSRRGGSGGLRNAERALSAGGVVAFTPDGPRGPRMRAKPGAVKAAQLAGVPILPAAAASSRQKLLTSWDRFALPLPFGRVVILWGEPLEIPRAAEGADLDRLVAALEDRLNELTAEADRRCGRRDRLAPAPVGEG